MEAVKRRKRASEVAQARTKRWLTLTELIYGKEAWIFGARNGFHTRIEASLGLCYYELHGGWVLERGVERGMSFPATSQRYKGASP